MQHLMTILERQVDLTKKIMSLVPPGKENYAPAPSFMPMGTLLHHLAEAVGSFKAIAMNLLPSPEQFAEMHKRRQSAAPQEALKMLEKGHADAREALQKMNPDFYNNGIIKTPFMGDAPCWVVLAGALEHLINHRHQLFTYMKLMGMPVDTGTLYAGMLTEKTKT